MLWPIVSYFVAVLIGAITGFLIALSIKSGFKASFSQASVTAKEADARSDGAAKLETLVNAMYDLTSQVDDQVEHHSQRVSEITTSIDLGETSLTSSILAAGELLLTANQQLQKELQEARSEIQRQRDQLEKHRQESLTDSLTSLTNRRGFDREIVRYSGRRRGQQTALILIDIDHFKKFNDLYGHMVGDQVLKFFSRTLTTVFRETDFVARYGGEEFAAILVNTSAASAAQAADRARRTVAGSEYRIGELGLTLTASFGVSVAMNGESENEWIQRADKALYAAKNAGRNRCYLDEGDGPQPVCIEPPVSASMPPDAQLTSS